MIELKIPGRLDGRGLAMCTLSSDFQTLALMLMADTSRGRRV